MQVSLTIRCVTANILLFACVNAQALDTDLIHVRLKDQLDRPADGYCLDILGTGSNLRLELPLFVHNCKSGATPDSAITYTEQGQLLFPAVGVCVTAFGVNNTVLPGAPILLRPCDYRAAFFDTSDLQKFDFLKNDQFRLRGYELCLTVGAESTTTYSPSDRWRVLSLQSCSATSAKYSTWEMVPL